MRATGNIVLDRVSKHWKITCEPHVMQRLKRVFERIPKDRLGTAPLADTPANADELRWFLDRFPLAMTPEDRAELERRACSHTEAQSLVDRVLAVGYAPRPFTMAVQPRDYQRLAADLALTQRHLLLADDMGLGKTISALAVLSDPSTLPAIVVCPPNLMPQWLRQIERCLPSCNVRVIAKGTPYDLTMGKRNKPVPMPDIVVVSYSMLSGWAETFSALGFKSVVFDECQALRHEFSSKPGVQTQKYAAAMFLRDRMSLRLGLSGTPIYNRGGEIRNVLNALSADPVGSAEEFGRDFCQGGSADNATVEDPEALGSLLRARGLMLRRSRADVKRELPALSIIAQPIESDPDALKTVSDSVADLARRLLASGGDIDKRGAARDIDWKLRQATGIGKAPFVADFVRILVEQGEPVLLFGWHRAVYDIWKDKLADLGIVFFTGEESAKQKEASMAAFRSGEAKILAMSLRAAEGVDGLQDICSTVVYGELDWSPGVMSQDAARAHRDGQTKPVFAYVLLADDGCDPIMAEVLNVKQAQADGIFNPGIAPVEKIAEEDEHRTRSLAEAYLAKHDPAGLERIRAENAQKAGEKLAQKDAAKTARAARKASPAVGTQLDLAASPRVNC